MNSTEIQTAESKPAQQKVEKSAAAEHNTTSVEELKQIIYDARSAQTKWNNLAYHEKTSYLYKVRDYIVENCESIVDTISAENGKVKIDALSADVLPITMAISFYCKYGKRYLKDKKIRPGNIFLINKRSIERRVPHGVIGIISPWNYPFSIPMFEVIIALLSGNAVILKVAKETPDVGKVINEAFLAAGFPENVFN
jgi:succinate-semialdehyde dehydrogenase/glutarate-semialdehyde dehydrogenase